MSAEDADVLVHLIDRYRDKIIRYLRKRVPGDYVEDFTQETFLNAHAYIKKGNQLEKPLAFLYTTAGNIVRMYYRDGKMAAVTDTFADIDEAGAPAEAPTVEQSAMSEREFEAFCVAVARLPEKCQTAFVLRKVYQHSYKEIADYCGISVNTVKTYVKRGFEKIEAYYEERGNL